MPSLRAIPVANSAALRSCCSTDLTHILTAGLDIYETRRLEILAASASQEYIRLCISNSLPSGISPRHWQHGLSSPRFPRVFVNSRHSRSSRSVTLSGMLDQLEKYDVLLACHLPSSPQSAYIAGLPRCIGHSSLCRETTFFEATHHVGTTEGYSSPAD